MNLKNLMVDTKSAWIDYPGFPGFKVNITNLGRERLIKLRKGCVTSTFDRKTHQAVETLDDKKFIRKFTEETIKGWEGLKFEYLEQIMLVDISGQNPDDLLEYTADNAELLVTNSSDFDTWLNEVVNDLEYFRSGRDGESVPTPGEVAE